MGVRLSLIAVAFVVLLDRCGGAARAAGVEGIVLTPDGKPAVKAVVALAVPDSRTWIHNGTIDLKMSDVDTTETDSSGRFHFAPEDSDFYLVITHSTGYAQYKPQAKTNRRTINLDPWTRVEGACRVVGKPRAKVPITIADSEQLRLRASSPRITWNYATTTNAEGRFVFERVRAGRVRVGRDLPVVLRKNWAVVSGCMLAVNLPIGKAVHIDLGTPGRTVIGKLRAIPEYKKRVWWDQAYFVISVRECKVLSRDSYFHATIGPDGAFRLEDVPPGDYSMTMFLAQKSAGELYDYPLTVGAGTANDDARPIDLGEIALRKEQ